MLTLLHAPTLPRAYRGDGRGRPSSVPLPPERMPLVYNLRLRKRWRYVSVWSEALSLCAGSVEVGPVRQEFWAVWDRERERLYERTRLYTGHVDLSPGRVAVRERDLRVDVTLDEGPGLEVVSPDGDAYTWTRKQCGIRAHGTVTVAGEARPVEAVALVDENAGYHPRHTRWLWSGGAGTDARGDAVAWSVIVGLNDGARDSERTLWVNGVAREVGPVEFADDLSRVRFAEGAELRFTPEATRSREEDLLLVRSSYEQPFGRFEGTLPGGIELRQGFGVMERHRALW